MVEVTPEIKRVKELMKEVYDKGFNIYKCLNRLKKQIKLTEDFPPQAIIWTCESYLNTKHPIQNHWAWFIRVFRASSERYFSEQHQKFSGENKREGFSPAIKEIMKGIG